VVDSLDVVNHQEDGTGEDEDQGDEAKRSDAVEAKELH